MYLKKLRENRATKVAEMNALIKKAEEEQRAMSEDETKSFDALEEEIRAIDKSIEAAEKAASEDAKNMKAPKVEENRAQEEERAFENFVRGIVENRADTNLTFGDNGAVIPSSIANKIIKAVEDRCPIYSLATRYNVPGTLSIPYYDETTSAITVEYATEFTDPTGKSGKFKSIELKGFLARALCKISKSLINNSNFDILGFIVSDMSEKIAGWIEKELLVGTSNKIAGLSEVKQSVTAASATAIKADELIDLQEAIPDVFQAGAIWVMNKATRTAIRKLKDDDGKYLLNPDATARWGYTLLGKEVYTSDSMPTMAASATAIYYGDMSGLAVKLSEDINIQVLTEKYAEQHAVGVLGFVEIDAKVENSQKLAKLVMKAGA